MGIIPMVALAGLFFVMMFGIAFILNMLMKTVWFPACLFLLVILPMMVYSVWGRGTVDLAEHLASFRIMDYAVALAGFFGAVLSGWATRKLRLGGYKMF